ncbi:MAG: pyridoxine 5'-phosphate synthase [Muribaculaceae bacterium]|nr:pyridoxine 5'-phosphate synthase [Muribaculaceae bacterium]
MKKIALKTSLSVNINKIATLRNARGENRPSVEQAAEDCQRFGADGITVHPRPDERHIRRSDVIRLRPVVHKEFNIEGYPSTEFMQLVLQVKPEQVTLVPDAPDAVTSSAGWDVEAHFDELAAVAERLTAAGIRCSIFVDANPAAVRAAARAGADRVELYTKPYADLFPSDPERAVAPFVEAARAAHSAGIGVNAGHDLSLENLHFFASRVPHLNEVSIGHALICDALYLGLEETIRRYSKALEK